MASKLAQLDLALSELMDAVDVDDARQRRTLLLIIGDHGMTDDGNHGGASNAELSASLLMYAGPAGLPMGDVSSEPVPQIDLVPTVTLALGLPIPFGNLGALIPEPFTAHDVERGVALNAWQVQRYLANYAAQRSDFSRARLDQLRALLEDARRQPQHASTRAYRRYLLEAAAMCRDVWATFDVSLMFWGLGVHASAVVLLLVAGDGRAVGSAWAALLGALVLALLVAPTMQWLALGAASAWMASALWTLVPLRVPRLALPRRTTSLAGLLVALHGASLFSNSFIEAEQHVSHFVFATLMLSTGPTQFVAWASVASARLVAGAAAWPPLPWWLVATVAWALAWGVLRRQRWYVKASIASALAVHFAVRVGFSDLFVHSVFVRLVLPRMLYASCAALAATGSVEACALLLLTLVHAPALVHVCAWFAWQLAMLERATWLRDDAFATAVAHLTVARIFFFAAKHACDFATLDFDAGFVGLDDAVPAVAGVLIAYNALGPFIVVVVHQRPRWRWPVWLVSLDALLTAVFVCGARRHLMVWRVFAPKYVYDTLAMAATVTAAAVVCA